MSLQSIRRLLIPLVVLLVVLVGGTVFAIFTESRTVDAPGGVRPSETPSDRPTSPPAVPLRPIPAPPDRDPYDLAQRLRGNAAATINRVVNPNPVSYSEGQEDTFWVTNLETEQHFQLKATLRYVTPHLYMYVQSGLDLNLADIQRSANEFENRVYPCVRQWFGSEWTPGVDNDVHLTVLIGAIPGVAGYYSSADQYPLAVNPFSNQREIFYLNSGAIRLGTAAFVGTMAHEFQHMVHWNLDRGEQTWVNEGLSELSAELCGNGASFVRAFTGNPNVQLTGWAAQPSAAGPNYGAAYLFFKYLSSRFGPDSIKDLVAEPKHGSEGIDAWLARRGGLDFVGVFKDWVVANYLNDPAGGRFGYQNFQVQVPTNMTINAPGKTDGQVRQFAARYLELALPRGDYAIKFQGDTAVRIIGADPKSGRRMWWSNRADAMNSSLTREFDLSSARQATLTFWTWYDLERNWDYSYLSASTDGGRTWQLLGAKFTTSDNPVGSNYGIGWTGKSGGGNQPAWVEEQVDLSPFAGKRVLIRFETVNDDAVNFPGFVIDDLAIPEINYRDDAESEAGWTARGFVLLDDTQAQRFAVQIIRYGTETVVEDLPLDSANRGEYVMRGFGDTLRRAVLVVSGTTPVTTRETNYSVTIEQR